MSAAEKIGRQRESVGLMLRTVIASALATGPPETDIREAILEEFAGRSPFAIIPAMTEPNDDQLSEGLEAYLAQHAEVDEERFRERLAELIRTHPKRDVMESASQQGGALATQPIGDWRVKVSYVFGDRTALVGTINIRDCISGTGD